MKLSRKAKFNRMAYRSKLRTGAKSNAWSLYALVVIAYGTLFMFWQVHAVSGSLYFAGIVLFSVSLLPLAIWYRRGTRGLPMFELICVAYGAAYSPPIFLVEHHIMIMGNEVSLPSELVLRGVLLTTAALLSLIGSYYFIKSCSKELPLPRIDLPLKQSAIRAFICVALGLGLVGKALVGTTETRYGALVNVMANEFNIGIILLAYGIFSGEMRQSNKPWLYCCVGLGSLLGLCGGMLEAALIPLVLVFMVQWHAQRRFPFAFSVVIAGLLIVLTPIKFEFRDRVWNGGSEAGRIDLLRIWWESGQAVFDGQREGLEEHQLFADPMSRVDLLHKFAYVQLMTPEVVPYLEGESYQYLLYTFIPRIVWPEKPIASAATDLTDFAYSLRVQGDTSTNIGIGQIAEAYANFGWEGLLCTMLAQGTVFALLDRVLNGTQSQGGRAIYLSIMILFLNGIGTSAVVLFGSIIQVTIAIALSMRPFALSFSAESAWPTPGQARRRWVHGMRDEIPSEALAEGFTAERPGGLS